MLTGLSAVVSALEESLAPVRTQHAFSTQVIEIGEGEGEARSLTYFTASHFGVGEREGMVCLLVFAVCSLADGALWVFGFFFPTATESCYNSRRGDMS